MRSTSATSVQGRSDRHRPWTTAAVVLVVAIATAAVALIVLRPGIEAAADQTFLGYRFAQGYPHFEEGIVSYLLAGLVNAVLPYDPVTTNTVIRALATLLYMVSAGLLAWSVTGPARFWSFVAFLLLIVTSRFPFLWLSSELLVGAFLMLFLWSLVREYPTAVTGHLRGALRTREGGDGAAGPADRSVSGASSRPGVPLEASGRDRGAHPPARGAESRSGVVLHPARWTELGELPAALRGAPAPAPVDPRSPGLRRRHPLRRAGLSRGPERA